MVSPDTISIIIASIIVSSTPVFLAGLGELVTEKAGVLNLGVEGMILIGAVTAFAVTFSTGNILLAIGIAVLSTVIFSFSFFVLTQLLRSNQIASGLALTIFGIGLSALIGKGYVGEKVEQLSAVPLPYLRDIPFFGKAFFQFDALVYLSFILLILVSWFLKKTTWGLILRSIGENHDAAYEMGYNVILWRLGAISFGAAMSGLAGAYLSIAYTPHWSEGMSAGKGWIALALVVFSTWKPWWLFLGSCLFGSIMMGQLYLQGMGVPISSQFMSMLPYLATILVLTIISLNKARMRLSVPGSLGKIFSPGRKD